MPQSTFTDHQQKALTRIAKAFYQAYRLSGTVRMSFSVRSMADSDGNSVVEVYLSPQDPEAAATLWDENSAHHMQFLESMVPAELMGYQFILQIIPDGPDEIRLDIQQVLTPVTG
jgi:hypothetical protein